VGKWVLPLVLLFVVLTAMLWPCDGNRRPTRRGPAVLRTGVPRPEADPAPDPSPETDADAELRAPPEVEAGGRPVVWGLLTFDGEPVFGATVQAIEAGGEYVAGQSGTNTEGRFVVEIDRAGTYDLVPRSPRALFLVPKAKKRVTVAEGARLRADLELGEGLRLAGVVVDARGRPAEVELAAIPLRHEKEVRDAPAPDELRFLARSRTLSREDGRFVLRGLHDERYLVVSLSESWMASTAPVGVAGREDLEVRVTRARVDTLEVFDVRTGLVPETVELRWKQRRFLGGRGRPKIELQLPVDAVPTIVAPGYEPVPWEIHLRASSRGTGLTPAGAPLVALEIVDNHGHPVRDPVVRYHRVVEEDRRWLPHVGDLVLHRTGPGRFRARMPEGEWILVANEKEKWGRSPAAIARVTVPAAGEARVVLHANARVTARLRPGDDPENWTVHLSRHDRGPLGFTSLHPDHEHPDHEHTVAAGRYTVVWVRAEPDTGPPDVLSSEVELQPGEERVLERPPR